MSPDQTSLTLTRSCRDCGADIPWDGGPGRPRVVCDACRPRQWPPLRSEVINQSAGRPLARRTDPRTAHQAAASITPGHVEKRIVETYRLFGWLTPFECADVLGDAHDGTVRSAVGRLRKSGVLVETGTTRPSPRGRASMVLKLAEAS